MVKQNTIKQCRRDDVAMSTGNDNLDMVVNGMKKLLPVFDDISESRADGIEDFVDDILDLF